MLPGVARDAHVQHVQHVERVRASHARDLLEGAGRVALPTALDRKAPSWATDFGWQWLFPASRRYRDSVSERAR